VLNPYFRLRDLLDRESGQGLVEYALILVLVAIVVIAVLSLMGAQIQNAFRDVTNTLAG
jgi:pilus assembly protein Flp/PilA